ncbi:P27 family phage terminase small subunit [Streptosporangium sp. KLBMP 9127]|nr:P27 family phage terminase small subunit [Streptosporangium sp. KLBMP 9127]
MHGDRKDRINTTEPVPAAGDVVPPFELSDLGQAVWDRLAPDRIARGVLTAWDVDAFALFCESVAVTQSKVAAAHQPWEPKPGTASPLSELRAAIAMVASLGSRFGWTPADRAKLVTGEARRDPSEDLLSG